MKDVRKIIKEKRAEKGMSQVTLAKRSGVCQATISKLESLKHPIDFEVAVSCLKVLGMKLEIK